MARLAFICLGILCAVCFACKTGRQLQQIDLSNCAEYYQVQSGDSFQSIADTFIVPLDDLLAVNPEIDNINFILIGQQIRIPPCIDTCGIEYEANYKGELLIAGDSHLKDSVEDCCQACKELESCNVFVYCDISIGCKNGPNDVLAYQRCDLKFQQEVADGMEPAVWGRGPEIEFVSGSIDRSLIEAEKEEQIMELPSPEPVVRATETPQDPMSSNLITTQEDEPVVESPSPAMVGVRSPSNVSPLPSLVPSSPSPDVEVSPEMETPSDPVAMAILTEREDPVSLNNDLDLDEDMDGVLSPTPISDEPSDPMAVNN